MQAVANKKWTPEGQVETRYRKAGDANLGRGHNITVYVDRSLRPRGTDSQFGFPCF